MYVGTGLIGKVSTAGKARSRMLYALPVFSYRSGTVSIKVLSTGKPVQIDGLGISRA